MKKVLVVLLVLVGGFLAYAATRPDSYRVERTLSIAAPANVVFDKIDDFKAWAEWSPWDKLDPAMQKTYDGPERGVGASYTWAGNKDVGKGKMTVTEHSPPSSVTHTLQFIEPWEGTAESGFLVKGMGPAVDVTWWMEGKNNFVGKVFGMFMNLDAMIGQDFDKGLAELKKVAEAEFTRLQAAQAEAERAAAEAAAERAAAEAAAAGPPVTLAGTMLCGKCALGQTDSCQNVLQVKQGKAEVSYFLTANEVAQAAHGPVCAGKKKATVTGTVREEGGKKLLTATTIDYGK